MTHRELEASPNAITLGGRLLLTNDVTYLTRWNIPHATSYYTLWEPVQMLVQVMFANDLPEAALILGGETLRVRMADYGFDALYAPDVPIEDWDDDPDELMILACDEPFGLDALPWEQEAHAII